MLPAAADNPRIRALATVAGHYRDHEGDIAWLTEDGYKAHLENGERATQKYGDTGEVEYVPAVDKQRSDVGMPGELVWSWYHLWADRGEWENRYAAMSDADLLKYESVSAAHRMNKPWLMVHSDGCMLPPAAKRISRQVKANQTAPTEFIVGDITQRQDVEAAVRDVDGVEEAVRSSGLPYTIVRPGLLTNDAGTPGIRFEQGDRGEGQVARGTVAEVCVQALHRQTAQGKTFEVYNDAGTPFADWSAVFAALHSDSIRQTR